MRKKNGVIMFMRLPEELTFMYLRKALPPHDTKDRSLKYKPAFDIFIARSFASLSFFIGPAHPRPSSPDDISPDARALVSYSPVHGVRLFFKRRRPVG